MSIWPALKRVIAIPLAQDCLLCGSPAGDRLLCRPCSDSLPVLAGPTCPVCALPSPQGDTCGACLRSPPHFDASFALWRYAFPVDCLVQALKFQHRLALGRYFAAALHEAFPLTADLMLPVPLSAGRLRERGFNQAMEIARPLAMLARVPLGVEDCRRTADTVAQSSLPWKERHRNIRNAFECAVDLGGKAVVVVDDVMTTGATLNEVARTLKAHGAARVINCVAARVLRD